MPQVYEGDRPYIFVSYAYADGDVVLPILDALVDEGYRVWYDAGIQKGTEFPNYIADHVHDCECLVMFISRASKASSWCRSEVNYALELGKSILPIYLEDIELGRGLQMRIGTKQAMYWYKSRSDDAFCEELFGASMLEPCLTEEGKKKRGVKPRDPGPIVLPPDGPNPLANVEPKYSLADYSWDELKLLSRAIAGAESDAEGLVIARKYYLVDPGCRLRGDAKPLVLSDGTKSEVRILGFRHDRLATGDIAGVTFEFANVPATHRMNLGKTNAGGWEKSEMRRWLNTVFLAMLPDDLRLLVESARKRANNKGQVSKNDTAAVTETADKLWLLSMREVYGELSVQGSNALWLPATYDVEGTQYQFYENKGVTLSNYEFCKKKGESTWWWLRSPHAYWSNRFRVVSHVGSWYGNCADGDYGVSPGFCF